MAAFTAIDDPEAFFQTVIYTGNGSANNAITLPGDTDMQPDLVWIKNRDATDGHCLFDAVRGATKLLDPAETAAETTDADTLDSFTSDGFQVDADVKVNTDAEKYVAWCWKAGTTSGISTDGNETLTLGGYSFNQTSGVSIIKYTGTTGTTDKFPHGLGAVPHMMIIKDLDGTGFWSTYHHRMASDAETDFVRLNNTTAAEDDLTMWYDTVPTAYNVTLGTGSQVNGTGNYMAYIFSEKQGFSKFGSYHGNGNAEGPFVYTGFRPAFVMTKSIESTSSWHMFDNKREGYNKDNDPLEADATTVEATTDMIDILSNGFKFRIATDPNVAENYIYAAFAEAPFVNSNGVPCNAR
jgi:hypothetical protein